MIAIQVGSSREDSSEVCSSKLNVAENVVCSLA